MRLKSWPAVSLGDIGVLYASGPIAPASVSFSVAVKRYTRKNGARVKTHPRTRPKRK